MNKLPEKNGAVQTSCMKVINQVYNIVPVINTWEMSLEIYDIFSLA